MVVPVIYIIDLAGHGAFGVSMIETNEIGDILVCWVDVCYTLSRCTGKSCYNYVKSCWIKRHTKKMVSSQWKWTVQRVWPMVECMLAWKQFTWLNCHGHFLRAHVCMFPVQMHKKALAENTNKWVILGVFGPKPQVKGRMHKYLTYFRKTIPYTSFMQNK